MKSGANSKALRCGAFALLVVAFVAGINMRAASHEAARFRVRPASGVETSAHEVGGARAAEKDFRRTQGRGSLPAIARFEEVEGRGLLLRAWVNGAGPFTFALDTGAGAILLSSGVARAARVRVDTNRPARVGGLSGVFAGGGYEGAINSLAVGERENRLPAGRGVVVADVLPPDIDGVLDPAECYPPLGYVIDLPRGELSAFDPRVTPLSPGDVPAGGAVVAWLSDSNANSRRPFVMLSGGRRALLDTGSGFGLALTPDAARALGIAAVAGGRAERDGRVASDVAGRRVTARRIKSSTVRLGPLVLRNVPTDLLSGASAGAPVLLGRDALRPFRLEFDPINRLIRIAPPPHAGR